MKKILIPWIRRRLPKLVIGGAVSALMAGCASTSMTTPQASLAACKSLKHVTVALTQVKPLMTPTVVSQTTLALETAAGYCTTPNPPANANAAVSAILNSLNTLTQVLAEQKGAMK